jgi:hypothetical protein
MATIVATFNTKEKTLSCTVDGQAVANVDEVYMIRGYSDESKYGCALTTRTEDKDEGTMHMTRLVANEQGELVDDGQVRADIAKFIGRDEG